MVKKYKSREAATFDVSKFDREKALEELKATKAGVKGLVDSGIVKVPEAFKVTEVEYLELHSDNGMHRNQVPIINLEGYQGERRKHIVNEIRRASRTWGIFQIVNHGVPEDVLSRMLENVREFHEQPKELKEEFYTHDSTQKVQYYMTLNNLRKCALWKDTISFKFEDIGTDIQALPLICRSAVSTYIRYILAVKGALCKLLSEGLGLQSDHLELMECVEAIKLAGHYYPPCPEPNLTMGTSTHTDPYLLTILLQSDNDGLQVFHQNEWIDVPPVKGALIVLIGDMLQLISNDSYKSAEHRVLAQTDGPRLSTATFFYPSNRNRERAYGPVKALLSNDSPSYRETTHAEYVKCFNANGHSGRKVLPHFREKIV